ncbi:MAG: cyclic nucleotide-binding domain-containing protein, partial [Myxococcales bacterium]
MKATPALDPVAFLRATPPFDRLPRPAFESAARALEIVFLPAGTRLLAHGDAPLAHLYVIRKGAVRLERSGETVQVLEEGELVGLTSLFSGTTPLDATVLEDVLAYRISRAALHPLLADPAFAAHFASGLADRLRHSLERTPDATYHANFAAPVGSFVRRPPVRVPAHATVGEAARAMRDAHVTSVLVDSSPAGIVTDRDLRNRVLAEDLGPATPI